MTSSKSQKSVLIICGDYMEDFEAMVPFQALQAYGISVDTVCPGKKAGDTCHTVVLQQSTQIYTETPSHKFTLNATFDEIEASNYDGLVIPGARAPEYLAMNESILELVTKFAHSEKPIASICHGSLILAAAGVVKGRTVTAFPSLKSVLVHAGAHWIEPRTMGEYVKDGNLITGATYEAHPQYIALFVEALGGIVSGPHNNKRILFLCGDFTEQYEVMVPFQALQVLGCHVDSASPKKVAGDSCLTAIHEYELGDQTYNEKPGYKFPITTNYEGLSSLSYDALVLPGGRAPEFLCLNDDVLVLVKEFMNAGKPVAAISHGQLNLSAANLLKGRKCTAHPGMKLNVVLAGATWVKPDPIDISITDGNLVTAAGWHGHPQFISQLMELLGIEVSF